MNIKINCKICGKEFKVEPNRIRKGGGKYCSIECAKIGKLKENNPNWKGGLVKKYCIICNKEFNIKPSKMKRGSGKYCSYKCMGIGRTGEKSRKWKGGKIQKACILCGNKFYIYKSVLKYGRGKFCSDKCLKIYYSKENHPNWKGGIKTAVERIRNCDKYKEWKQKIFIRDKFTCQKCNTVGGILHAHHKKKFSELINEIKNNLPLLDLYEGAMIYIPLWDINNGITLCKKCHKKIEKSRRGKK